MVTVDGRIGQRACLTKVADGMQVTGAAPAALAPLGASPDGDAAPEESPDVLVVGGGPAGLSAAIAAAEAGAAVVLLDERAAPGGQYAKPLADSHADAAPDAQFRIGIDLRDRAQRAGVRIESEVRRVGRLRAGRDRRAGARAGGDVPASAADPRAGRA